MNTPDPRQDRDTDPRQRQSHPNGHICAIRGSVVDVRFDREQPPIRTLLRAGDQGSIALEVMAQLDAQRVRCIALTTTQGLARGMPVQDTGAPLQAPIGAGIVSRMFDVFGNAIDHLPPPDNYSPPCKAACTANAKAPSTKNCSTSPPGMWHCRASEGEITSITCITTPKTPRPSSAARRLKGAATTASLGGCTLDLSPSMKKTSKLLEKTAPDVAPAPDRLQVVAGKVVATMNLPSAAQKRFNTLMSQIDTAQATATTLRQFLDQHASAHHKFRLVRICPCSQNTLSITP